MVETKKGVRDANATKARILDAAKGEFARLGLGGARVDEIAEKAKANKRMIYHYFGNKEELFKVVLEEAYLDIRGAELSLELEHLAPDEALKTLVRFTWNYYLENPAFIRLVNSENLHQARHIAESDRLVDASRKFTDLVGGILKRGEKDGVFRKGIDPVQLNITIAAIGYYYLTNRFTGAILFEREFMSKEALQERLEFNLDTVMRLVVA
ncbi:TetR family transcriptional regulator [Shimia abyssi]|uniref:TetR family transcriptional regulator n=1 Tax=Shimia abyssi TaxID=1662395 RepID=A0A2P8F651_9RHOB|nr:TetR family transcriptional regulator [Shimia abyssi]PSL17203.1 TetR family transcriptional regulator [Shimia abyssi]